MTLVYIYIYIHQGHSINKRNLAKGVGNREHFHHHQVTQTVRNSLTFSPHPSLSTIVPEKSLSGECKLVFTVPLTLVHPCAGVHETTSLMRICSRQHVEFLYCSYLACFNVFCLCLCGAPI